MIRKKYWVLIAVFAFFVLFASATLYADDAVNTDNDVTSQDSEIQIIDIDVAKLVARDYLAKLKRYKGEWNFFDYYVCYDLDGMPAAYAIVFRRPDTQITTHEELNSKLLLKIEERNRTLNQISQLEKSRDENIEKIKILRKLANSKIRALYMQDQFATVITGATSVSPLHINHYRGLPTFFVKQPDIQTTLRSQFPDKTFQLVRLLYLSPIDIRYEIQEGNEEPLSRQPKEVGSDFMKQNILDEVYITRKGDDIANVASLREEMKGKKLKKESALAEMSSEKRKLIEEGRRSKKSHYAKRWEQYKNMHLKEME